MAKYQVHPLNSKYFGPQAGKIAIKFHNGASVVTGYIVKQLGLMKYRVSDGTVTKDVVLVSTVNEANALTGNQATIEINGGSDFLSRINGIRGNAIIGGNTVIWESIIRKVAAAQVGNSLSFNQSSNSQYIAVLGA